MSLLMSQLVLQSTNSLGRVMLRQTFAKLSFTRQERESGRFVLKRTHWNESDLDELSELEQDLFERKSGELYGQLHFREELAKTLSALANSGGGHVIFGVRDDGTPDGLPPLKGRERMSVWLEKVIPNLLNYNLHDFRVHEVVASTPSRIPLGKIVVVIDVGDSALAPHLLCRRPIFIWSFCEID